MSIVIYSLLMFYFMYMTVYSIERFTLLRGTGMVILFSLYLLCMLDNKKIIYGVLVLHAIGLIALPMNLNTFMENRYSTQEVRTEWYVLEEVFEDILKIKETNDPWVNTIAIFTLEPKVIAAIPDGFESG